MLEPLKAFVKTTPLAYPYIALKSLVRSPRPQNDEDVVLERLLARHRPVPRTFVEFGFSGWEFNCASLAETWTGLLLDGDGYNCTIARTLFDARRVTARETWLTLDNLDIVETWLGGNGLGVLSIDVDGNDYWFLRRLIGTRPSIIIAEYNSSLGLRPVTVPYDPDFDRRKKHPSRLYYGASLQALWLLASRHGYSLVEVGNTGINAFFVRNDLLSSCDRPLLPEHCFREKSFPDGSRHVDQWKRIEHMPYVDVSSVT